MAKAKPATITVRHGVIEGDDATLRTAFGDDYASCRFSRLPAPDHRGVEIHVTSNDVGQKTLKQHLRDYRALVEAGEIPTGAPHK